MDRRNNQMKDIIGKCLVELKSEKPDISYIRGMLEVLQSIDNATFTQPQVLKPIYTTNTPVIDLGRVPAIGGIAKMVNESLKTE